MPFIGSLFPLLLKAAMFIGLGVFFMGLNVGFQLSSIGPAAARATV